MKKIMTISSTESRLQVSIARAILFPRSEASADEQLGCGQTDQLQNYRKRRLNYGQESSTEKEGSSAREEGCPEESRSEEKRQVTRSFNVRNPRDRRAAISGRGVRSKDRMEMKS